MNLTKTIGICVVVIGMLALTPSRAQDVQAPDAMMKSLVDQTIKAVKANPALQSNIKSGVSEEEMKGYMLDSFNNKAVGDYVRTNIRPHVDAKVPASLALGGSSGGAKEQQGGMLSSIFSDFMAQAIFTVLAACTDDCTIQFLPMRIQPSDTKAVVQTTLQLPGKPTGNMSYSLIKTGAGWKIFDVNVNGESLMSTAH